MLIPPSSTKLRTHRSLNKDPPLKRPSRAACSASVSHLSAISMPVEMEKALDALIGERAFVGVRHLVNVEPDPDRIGRVEGFGRARSRLRLCRHFASPSRTYALACRIDPRSADTCEHSENRQLSYLAIHDHSTVRLRQAAGLACRPEPSVNPHCP
jgi:hypothetical protein